MLQGYLTHLKGIVCDAPNPFDTSDRDVPAQYQANVRELREDGFTLIPNYFPKSVIEPLAEQARKAFADPAMSVTAEKGGKPYNTTAKDPFLAVPGLLKLAIDPLIVGLARAYFRRSHVVLADASLEHLPPVDTDAGSYLWHYDMRGKQVKCMILLTDVPADGQHFTFLKGSHVRRPLHASYDDSRFSTEEVFAMGKEKLVDAVGPMGSIALFDTNGIHRGTRRATHVRENMTVNYKTGHQYLYNLKYPPELVAALSPEEREIVRAASMH